MIGNNPDIFIKKAVEIYNEDKLPALQITNDLGDKMLAEMFRQLKYAMDKPYAYKIMLTKFTTFTMRRNNCHSKITDLIQRIRWYKIRQGKIEQSPLQANEPCPFTRGIQSKNEQPRTMQEEYEHLEERIAYCTFEIKRWWTLRMIFMKSYTKTAKYRRLVKIRGEQRRKAEAEGTNLEKFHWSKEDMIAKRLTYIEKRHKVWSMEDDE